jgi:hypothetical protein
MKTSLRDKIRFYDALIIDRDTLVRIIKTVSDKMTINDACTMGYVVPIKPGKTYLNKLNGKIPNTSIIGAAYAGDTEYMIWGMRIYNMYGFTTQLAEVTDVYTLKYSRERYLDGQRFVFRKVKKEFLYGFEEKVIQGYATRLMSRERAFLEYVRERRWQSEWDFFEIYESCNLKTLQQLLKKYPLKNVIKKITQIQQLCISKK